MKEQSYQYIKTKQTFVGDVVGLSVGDAVGDVVGFWVDDSVDDSVDDVVGFWAQKRREYQMNCVWAIDSKNDCE